MPRLRFKDIQITSIAAPQPPADEGGSSSRGGTYGSYIPEAVEALNVVIINEKGVLSRRRGKTRLPDVYKLKPGERVGVHGNDLGQPIGNTASLLGGHMGKLAQNGRLLPLNVRSWSKITPEEKARVVQRVKDKFHLISVSDAHIRKSVSKKWRDFKNKLKRKYFDENMTPDAVKARQTDDLVKTQWDALVDYWFTEEAKDKSKQAALSRAAPI